MTAGPESPPSDATQADAALERWIRMVTSVLAPTTVLTGLLFYFGYVSTAAEFGYFGVSLGALNLSTQEFLLRSVAALYVPVGVLFTLLLVLSWAHGALTRTVLLVDDPRRRRIVAGTLIAVGALLTARGVLGVLVPSVAASEAIALTPTTFGLGVLSLSYGHYLLDRPARHPHRLWHERLRVALVAGLIVLSLFWAANSFAAAYGRGRAQVLASNLHTRPAVVLDSTERLFITYPGITETSLSVGPEDRFHYRYRGLRLLIETGGRMFLLPEHWEVGTGATVVIPVDGDARVQFYRTGSIGNG